MGSIVPGYTIGYPLTNHPIRRIILLHRNKYTGAMLLRAGASMVSNGQQRKLAPKLGAVVEEMRWRIMRTMQPGDRLPTQAELKVAFDSGNGLIQQVFDILECRGLHCLPRRRGYLCGGCAAASHQLRRDFPGQSAGRIFTRDTDLGPRAHLYAPSTGRRSHLQTVFATDRTHR